LNLSQWIYLFLLWVDLNKQSGTYFYFLVTFRRKVLWIKTLSWFGLQNFCCIFYNFVVKIMVDVFWRQQSTWRQIKSCIVTNWWYLLLNSLFNFVFAFKRCNLKACFCRWWLQNLGLINRSLILTSSSRGYWRE